MGERRGMITSAHGLERVAAGLPLEHLDDVILLQVERQRSVFVVNAVTVVEESQRGNWQADDVAVRLLQLAQKGGFLYAKVILSIGLMAEHLDHDVVRVLGSVVSLNHCWSFSWSAWSGVN